MSRDPESESKGWWQTLPGLLTAAAATITAVTGLLVAVHQAGFFHRSPQPASQTQTAQPTESVAPAPSTGATTSRVITPAGNTQIAFGDAVFNLASARVEPYSPDKVSVHFTVLMTNNNTFDANLWAASFRLLAGGSLLSPTNNLDEIVSAHSTKQGDVEFIVPANISTVGLQMGDIGEGKPTVAINLQKP